MRRINLADHGTEHHPGIGIHRRLLQGHKVMVDNKGRTALDVQQKVVLFYWINQADDQVVINCHWLPKSAEYRELLTVKFLEAGLLLERADGTALVFDWAHSVTWPYQHLVSRAELYTLWQDQRALMAPPVPEPVTTAIAWDTSVIIPLLKKNTKIPEFRDQNPDPPRTGDKLSLLNCWLNEFHPGTGTKLLHFIVERWHDYDYRSMRLLFLAFLRQHTEFDTHPARKELDAACTDKERVASTILRQMVGFLRDVPKDIKERGTTQSQYLIYCNNRQLQFKLFSMCPPQSGSWAMTDTDSYRMRLTIDR